MKSCPACRQEYEDWVEFCPDCPGGAERLVGAGESGSGGASVPSGSSRDVATIPRASVAPQPGEKPDRRPPARPDRDEDEDEADDEEVDPDLDEALDEDLVCVHPGGDPVRSGFLRSLLEEEGIPAVVTDEHVGSLLQLDMLAGQSLGRVLVPASRADEARAFLERRLDEEEEGADDDEVPIELAEDDEHDDEDEGDLELPSGRVITSEDQDLLDDLARRTIICAVFFTPFVMYFGSRYLIECGRTGSVGKRHGLAAAGIGWAVLLTSLLACWYFAFFVHVFG